jgi:hypothetical protein
MSLQLTGHLAAHAPGPQQVLYEEGAPTGTSDTSALHTPPCWQVPAPELRCQHSPLHGFPGGRRPATIGFVERRLCALRPRAYANKFERSLDALSEVHDPLEPGVHGWLLAVLNLILA